MSNRVITFEHFNNVGWEVNGAPVGYTTTADIERGETVTLRLLGSNVYVNSFKARGFGGQNVRPYWESPTNNVLRYSETGDVNATAAIDAPLGANPYLNGLQYRAGGDPLGDGEENLAIRFTFTESSVEMPDNDVSLSLSPAIEDLASDASSLSLTISDSDTSKNTQYNVYIRNEGGSDYTHVGSGFRGTGTGASSSQCVIPLNSYIPNPGEQRTYFVRAILSVANGGNNNEYSCGTVSGIRPIYPGNYGFEFRNSDDEVVVDISSRMWRVAQRGRFYLYNLPGAGKHTVYVDGLQDTDDWIIHVYSPGRVTGEQGVGLTRNLYFFQWFEGSAYLVKKFNGYFNFNYTFEVPTDQYGLAMDYIVFKT